MSNHMQSCSKGTELSNADRWTDESTDMTKAKVVFAIFKTRLKAEWGGKLHFINYISLHYTTIHYITLYYITLHYITLHNITLHYITLHYTTLIYMRAACNRSKFWHQRTRPWWSPHSASHIVEVCVLGKTFMKSVCYVILYWSLALHHTLIKSVTYVIPC
jgi:hypothetical protein